MNVGMCISTFSCNDLRLWGAFFLVYLTLCMSDSGPPHCGWPLCCTHQGSSSWFPRSPSKFSQLCDWEHVPPVMWLKQCHRHHPPVITINSGWYKPPSEMGWLKCLCFTHIFHNTWPENPHKSRWSPATPERGFPNQFSHVDFPNILW